MKKNIIALAAVILLVVFISTFIQENNVDNDNNKNKIIMAVNNLGCNFDKISSFTEDDENIICATCRGLINVNSNNEVILDLAKELNISEDGIQYDFTLKDDIYWSDGEKIKAEDILLYFKTLMENEEDKDIEALLNIYGADKFNKGLGTFEKDVAITSEGNVIKIRLNKKDDDFLLKLSKPQYRIRKDLYLWHNFKNNYERIIYSGRYSINEINESFIELRDNNNEESKRIVMIQDENKEESMASYEIGQRDIVVDPSVSQVSRLDENKRILSSLSGEGIYLAINSEKINLGARRELVKEIYEAAEEYYLENKKVVKLSEGSYFEKEMDELDKLQSRKVSISSSQNSELPSKIKILIEDDEVIEDFVKYVANYFLDNNITIAYEVKKEGISEEEYDMQLTNFIQNTSKKDDLYNNLKSIFIEQNKKYFTESSKIEESFFDSCTFVPVMFLNRNIAVSDKVGNVRLDGNGNIDFSGLD